ncbi:uncharacterized protein LOC131149183 [Malania oleifera]|uniref:uncharacterized protein LOC131149183 n=1 Tax=Malania oleifera TaxID=397392 RepID=UPI0025AE1E98|nr:uncharacterized protein LOC131149183 [Malania oleifera]
MDGQNLDSRGMAINDVRLGAATAEKELVESSEYPSPMATQWTPPATRKPSDKGSRSLSTRLGPILVSKKTEEAMTSGGSRRGRESSAVRRLVRIVRTVGGT